MKKIGKTQAIKKKNPSLIFDIFRDGKVSFDIKNINLFCLQDLHKLFFTLSYFEYLNKITKKSAFSRKLQNRRF
jgi:hypothetical protein